MFHMFFSVNEFKCFRGREQRKIKKQKFNHGYRNIGY